MGEQGASRHTQMQKELLLRVEVKSGNLGGMQRHCLSMRRYS